LPLGVVLEPGSVVGLVGVLGVVIGAGVVVPMAGDVAVEPAEAPALLRCSRRHFSRSAPIMPVHLVTSTPPTLEPDVEDCALANDASAMSAAAVRALNIIGVPPEG
jgi:hypothetical protein